MIYREGSFGTYAEDTFGTLRACGGNNGGGSETLIIDNEHASYGVVSKGNGDAFLMEEKHMSLTIGGGQAGQGYPCAMAVNKEITALHILQDPITSDTVTPCISAGSPNGQAAIGVNVDYTVRRLTPLECERLQGYPDYWTDIGAWVDENGKGRSESADSARYKAIGNSIALPPWEFVLQRLSICCGDNVTMASLFDGIGGFPLIWERMNGVGACLWASEIEEFPIAVTKRHFSEVNNYEQGFL